MQAQLKPRSSWEEWKHQHCSFSIGELDDLKWSEYAPDIESVYIIPYSSFFTMYFRHTLSERLVRCTQEQVMWCTERCPHGLESFKDYFKGDSDD